MRPVVVYQIGALGDTIVSIPAYRAVRRHFKGDRVLLLEAELEKGRVQPSEMLLREGLIDGTVRYPHKAQQGKTDLLALWAAAFKARPKAVVYIGPAERPAKLVERDKLFFKTCFPQSLVGFHGIDYASFEKRDSDGNAVAMPLQAKMRLDRLAQDGVDAHADDLATPLLHPGHDQREAALDWLSERRIHPQRKLLFMGVSTAQPATRWPVERFEQLGRRVLAEQLAEIVVVGGPAEKHIGESLTKSWNDGIVAAGAFDVHGTAALFTLADLYVGLDTGTTHLAAAVDAPIVALYSEHNPPGEWDPMGHGHTILRHRVPCQVCRQVTCPVEGHPCMTGITIDQVWEVVQSRLK